MRTGLGVTLMFVFTNGCQGTPIPGASPTPPEAVVRDLAVAPEQQGAAEDDCGLAEFAVSQPTHAMALIAGQGGGETGHKLSSLVRVRYRLDSTGAMTHLKLVEGSSYGVKATDDALAMLKKRRFAPVVVGGKAQAACVDAAVTIHMR